MHFTRIGDQIFKEIVYLELLIREISRTSSKFPGFQSRCPWKHTKSSERQRSTEFRNFCLCIYRLRALKRAQFKPFLVMRCNFLAESPLVCGVSSASFNGLGCNEKSLGTKSVNSDGPEACNTQDKRNETIS